MIRLSYSALDSLLTCERKFQLDRLLVSDFEKEEYPATILGKSFGVGVQTYLTTFDKEKAIYEAWKAYFPQKEEPGKRTEEHALSLLQSSFPHLDNVLLDWEVASFNGKPAVELSFRLDIDEKFYYVGYVDIILKNRWTGRYAVGEIKTTALKILDLSPIYQNSGQALGYSIILDSIVGEDQSDYDLLYFVGRVNEKHEHEFKTFPFPKTLVDRLNWFIALGFDVQRLHTMLEHNVFPMRGSSCLQYMRPCKHFGTCSLHSLDKYKEEEEDLIVYDFVFDLDQVISDHLKRIGD